MGVFIVVGGLVITALVVVLCGIFNYLGYEQGMQDGLHIYKKLYGTPADYRDTHEEGQYTWSQQ